MTRRQTIEVAMREVRTRGRSRGFRTITALMLLLAIAGPIVVSLIPDQSSRLRRATVGIGSDASPLFERSLQVIGTGTYLLTFVDLAQNTPDEIDAMLRDGEIDVAIEPPDVLAWDQTADESLANLATAALNQVAAIERGEALGLDTDGLTEIFTPLEISERFVDGASSSDDVRSGVALFGLFIAFILPQVFGQLAMLSVVEEKSTRVVEVLLSHIRPGTLLAGKIVGLCVLAAAQLTVIVLGLVGALLATNVVDVPASVWQFVPMLIVSVLGGLAIYITLFALLGSLISRQEDAAQVMMPVFAPLMVGYIVGQTAVFGDAATLWTRVLTWFPLTSPMLLPVRVARGAISPIETALAVALLGAGVVLLIKLASRVYEFTLLRTGSRVGWGELVRLSRGAVGDRSLA